MKATSPKKKALAKAEVKENEILLLQINAEQNLRKIIEDSEKRYNTMLMQSPFAFAILKGKDMVVAMANDSIKQMWGKGNKLEGKPLIEILPEIKDQEFPTLLHKVYTTGITYLANESLAQVKRKGIMEDLYFNFSYQPFRENDGTISGVIIFATEVTEQVIVKKALEAQYEKEKKVLKLVEEINKRYYTMLMESPFAFSVMKGKDMVITLANDLIKEFWGKGSEVEGKILLQVLPELKDQPFPAMLDKVYTTGLPVYANEILAELQHKDKMKEQYFNIVYQPDLEADGTISGVITIAYEVTEMVLARKKIEASKNQLQNILLNAPAAIAVFDGPQHRFIMANQAYQKQNNRTERDFLGKSFRKVFPELEGTGSFELFDGVYTTGKTFTASEYPAMIDSDNNGIPKQHYFNFSLEALKNESKEIYGVMVMAYDITEQVLARKKIEQNEKKFQAAILAVEGIIWTNNAIGEMEGEQLGWANLTGQRYEDYQGYGWAKMIHPNDVQPTIEAWNKSVTNKSTFQFEHRVKTKHHGFKLFYIKAVPVFDEKGILQQWVGVHTDISKQREIEEKLMEAKISAENATKSKQQFLSNMSHEIRTPLNSIIGFANVLLKTKLDVEQKEFLQAIKTSGKSLNLLINDILDLAKVDAGKMIFEKQPFQIRKSITSILHSFDLKIKEKNLKLIKKYDSKIPSMLLGDSLRLNQIFLNLLSNAVKFTHKGKIKLSVKLLSETEENVTLKFVVADSGIGIAENQLNSIFNIFEQAELSTSNSYGGTGLGLAIVKQLIESQGGSISLKSKIGEGSAFSFILPFGKTNIKLEKEIEVLKPDCEIKNLRVLVAEDVALNQLLIKIILSDFGFEYEIVGNGKIATEKLQTNTYDIILMDLQMPEMNGFEATEYIRKTLKSQIPIIALTADVTTADVSKCKEFGMDDYISKPINENLLYSKIVELVKNKQNY